MDDIPGKPSYSTVRAQLRILEEKGHVRHEEEALRYVYSPPSPATAARQVGTAAHDGHLLRGVTGEDGRRRCSIAVPPKLSEDQLTRLSDLIEKARKEGR